MSYCTACGQRLETAIRFCTACGTPSAPSSPRISAGPEVTTPQAKAKGIPVAIPSQPQAKADVRLMVIAGASVLVATGGFLAGAADLLPSGVSAVIVIIGATIGLRMLWSYAAHSASASSRAHTLQIVSNVGFAISVLSVLVGLPRITKGAGFGTFVVDATAELWTLAILLLMTSQMRTLNWRILTGAALTGFLGITGLARLVGVPVIDSLGRSSVFAVAIWVPFTEEFFKLIPVIAVLVVAVKHPRVRPSAMDLTLLGACTGAGFAMYENAILSRGHFSFTSAPLLSFIFPSDGAGRAFGWPLMQTGHLCHTALIAMGLALAVLYYRKNIRLKWVVPCSAIGVVLLEHCSQNAIATGGLNEILAKITVLLTLGGWLSSLLLIAGLGFVFTKERRILRSSFRVSELGRLSAMEVIRRSTLLAKAQTGGDF